MPPTTNAPLLVNQVGNQWTLTISSSVVSLTVPAGGAYASIQCETNAFRVSEDPTNPPTVANGTRVAAGQFFVTYNPGRVRLIRDAAADAVVQIAYYN